MADDVRVRFSPAPTGMLHVGSARTALFNWLFARHTKGTFLLRIEDTDVARSRTEWVEQIQHTLTWLGVDWDEGPFLQSHRFDDYLAGAQRLLAEGAAYECFCTEDEVRERNEQARAEGRPPGYDGRCRDLAAAQRDAFVAEGRARSLRFRTPDAGRSTFEDAIRGEVGVDWSTISDFVIVRSNGTPVFFLANAIDDIDMGITHVLRGEDLIDSTHRVLALRRALGRDDQPVYAHLPLILGPGGAKLSKRHGAVALEEFRDAGYLPSAVRNYLALLGWAPGDDREVLSTEEIVDGFDLERITHSSAMFDHKKLDWLNGEHIRAMSVPDLAADVIPFAREAYGQHLDVRVFETAVGLAQQRATTLVQIAEQAEFLFVPDDEFRIDDDVWEIVERAEGIRALLDALHTYLSECEWTLEALDLRGFLGSLGLKANKKTMPPLYAVFEGRPAGLPLFDSIHLLGKERALRRVRAARDRLG
jgi:glutamyl-tRNA synthetase